MADKDLPWSKPFRKRCKGRLKRRSGLLYWGRCELAPHWQHTDHALERGLIIVRWETGDIRGIEDRVYYEHAEMVQMILAERLENVPPYSHIRRLSDNVPVCQISGSINDAVTPDYKEGLMSCPNCLSKLSEEFRK